MLKAKLKFPAKRQKVSAFSLQPSAFACPAFTLIEMLVVISILGILAALTVPALKGLGKANTNMSATAQLLGDVGRARQLAIANHTTVYMVFVPTNFWLPPYTGSATWSNGLTPAQLSVAVNLCGKQLTGYNFLAYGAVGDQPGRHQWHYLAQWQELPEGTFIPSSKFMAPSPVPAMIITDYAANQGFGIYGFGTNAVPFPTQDSANNLILPCIAFNYLGQLTSAQATPAPLTQDEYIPLARGAVLDAVDQNKNFRFAPANASESPPGNSTNSAFNLIDIDPLTGRATLRFEKVR